MKIFFDSLGCPKSLVDAEKMSYFIESEGNELVFQPEEADTIIINTCGFITPAKMESIEAILSYVELKQQNPNLRIVVSGCLTERYGSQIKNEIPEIDSIIGVRDPLKIIQTLKQDSDDLLDQGEYSDTQYTDARNLTFSGLITAYLKVSEGCDRSCSFCAIPLIRGPQRSRDEETILKEAKVLRSQGMEELILIAEDTTAYGISLYQEKRIIHLLKRILVHPELDFHWIRLLYLFPDPIILEIAELMREHARLCDYIDIPLQHVSEKILKSMNRPGDDKYYRGLFDKIRSIHPNIAIRSAFIIGYPGETQDDFNILKNFLKEMQFNRVGFFAYSNEENTRAYNLTEQIPEEIVNDRISELMNIQQEISQNKLKQLIGKQLTCINDGKMVEIEGTVYNAMRSEYDAPEIDGMVLVPASDENDEEEIPLFRRVTITDVYEYHDLFGTLNGDEHAI